MVSEGLVEEGYAPKVQQISLEKELNELLSKTNELKGNKETIQTIEELKFKLKAAKERLLISKKFETKGNQSYCIWTGS